MASPTPFGAPMKELFLIDPNYHNLNHGSFGTYPKAIQKPLHHFQSLAEASPDIFIRQTQPKALEVARAAVAQYLNVPTTDCVLVKNATTGVGTILHNIQFTPEDAIIYFDTVYGAVERALISLTESTPLNHIRKVPCVLPLTHEEIVRRFEQTVARVRGEGLNPKLAVFDVIVSNPGVRFPFERLTEVCRANGILSLVDGAHGVGHIPLDLGVLRPDFLTSNCHKWLFTPRSCAVLYVAPQHQPLIRTTLPTSWGFIPSPSSSKKYGLPPPVMRSDADKTAFEALFQFVATTDDTPYLCVPDALRFRAEVCGGEERIYQYLEALADEAGEVVAGALGTDIMGGGSGGDLRRCAMVTVRLPIRVAGGGDQEEGDAGAAANDGKGNGEGEGVVVVVVQKEQVDALGQWMQNQLVEQKTFIPVFPHGEWMWVRLSAQVYLEKSDFVWAAEVLKDLCGRAGGFLASL